MPKSGINPRMTSLCCDRVESLKPPQTSRFSSACQGTLRKFSMGFCLYLPSGRTFSSNGELFLTRTKQLLYASLDIYWSIITV
jgi:hypothetical protein